MPMTEGNSEETEFGTNGVSRTREKIEPSEDTAPYAPGFGVGVALIGKERKSAVSQYAGPSI